jgi:hypothetical protein
MLLHSHIVLSEKKEEVKRSEVREKERKKERKRDKKDKKDLHPNGTREDDSPRPIPIL